MKKIVGNSRYGLSNYQLILLVTYGILMMPDRNNYARIDVGILYRLRTVMYQMCVHNYSVQSVDSSERTIVVYVQIVSFRIGFLIVLIDFC